MANHPNRRSKNKTATLPVKEDMMVDGIDLTIPAGLVRTGEKLTPEQIKRMVDESTGLVRNWAPIRDYESEEYKAGKRTERIEKEKRNIMVANPDAPVRVNVQQKSGPPTTLTIYQNMADFEAQHAFADYRYNRSYGTQDETIILVTAMPWAGKERSAKPAAPKGKTKAEFIKDLLLRPEGCTTKDVLEATGWPSVSMPAQAKAVGLKLKKIKEGGVTKYWGIE